MTDLKISVSFDIEGHKRVNNLKLHHDGINLMMEVQNGKTEGGNRKYARIRLNAEFQKQLLEFVQSNIK